MLHEFLAANRAELVRRCRAKAAARRAPHATPPELAHGVPFILDQLAAALARHARADGSAGTFDPGTEDAAARHGGELRLRSYTIEQVVHEYGDICQAITELAHERGAPVTAREFGMLSIQLDNAIAHAVSEFVRPGDVSANGAGIRGADERLAVLASDMREALEHTVIAVNALKAGGASFGGDAAALLEGSLADMRAVIERTLAECDPVRPAPVPRRY